MQENRKNEDEEIIIRCPACGVRNRLKTLKLQKDPRCGKCRAILIEMREFGPHEREENP